jgi:hypothetical protein
VGGVEADLGGAAPKRLAGGAHVLVPPIFLQANAEPLLNRPDLALEERAERVHQLPILPGYLEVHLPRILGAAGRSARYRSVSSALRSSWERGPRVRVHHRRRSHSVQ